MNKLFVFLVVLTLTTPLRAAKFHFHAIGVTSDADCEQAVAEGRDGGRIRDGAMDDLRHQAKLLKDQPNNAGEWYSICLCDYEGSAITSCVFVDPE